uniref:Uncharacterized protein n=1 Tax=Arundo donax TaxID=35708 RepID=A0A0A9EZA0_ARUDO
MTKFCILASKVQHNNLLKYSPMAWLNNCNNFGKEYQC